jgi:4-aminobutyrate aminotransferase-like enzyme
MIGDVRGRGLLIGVEFVADRRTRRPFDARLRITERVVELLRERNVLVAAGVPLLNFGKDGDHIQISPPFTISIDEVELLVNALDDALSALEQAF